MTERQKRFCEEYLIDRDKAAAAIRAGYSEKHAYTTASRILNTPAVKEYMSQKEKTDEARQVIEYLTAVMRGEKWNGSAKGKGERAAAEFDKDITVRDRMKAAELLGKLCGGLSEKGGSQEQLPVILCGENDLED